MKRFLYQYNLTKPISSMCFFESENASYWYVSKTAKKGMRANEKVKTKKAKNALYGKKIHCS